ncbi:hypothetical protein MFUR16E_12615 [Methylobacterium fujisawaense]|uniref:ATP-binding protein n=1 Tax=Methylobacterium fujisawaense TaxID=107400 RepID=UPI002F30CC7B
MNEETRMNGDAETDASPVPSVVEPAASESATPVALPAPVPPTTDFSQVERFHLQIQGGILENLGMKMYTSVGKVLVEFAANAFDSDSPYVDVRFNGPEIEADRERVLAAAKLRAEQEPREVSSAGTRKPRRKAKVVIDPLSEALSIEIVDGGHGMTAKEMAERFLPLNRNRRRGRSKEEEDFYSEAGKRLVMGRKGIGKLSGFGVAERVTVRSKRKGQPYWTEINLRAADLIDEPNVTQKEIPHSYAPVDPAEMVAHGTVVTLRGIRCDAANFTEEEIAAVLNETFYPIKRQEFDIRINGTSVPKPAPAVDHIYPEDLGPEDMRTETLRDENWGEISFSYRVQFRKQRLDSVKRGAYIYSKGRLAMSPSMLSLTTGMHNFMAHQYMECIVETDDIDNLNIDVIGSNRSDIIKNSDVVRALLARIEDIMRDAIKANGTFREAKADKIIDEDPATEGIRRMLDMVAGTQKKNVRELAKTFLKHYKVDSDEFKHLTPLMIGAANAGEILIELIKVANSAESVTEIAPSLLRLREIERNDTIKVYRARRRAITGLQRIVAVERDATNKTKKDEKALHQLLKADPWLIRPDLSNFTSSDLGMDTVLDRLSKNLGIDGYAADAGADDVGPDDDDDTQRKKTVRPDLVSLVGNGLNPTHILVIELKAPGLPMRTEHLAQLRRYMRQIEEYVGVNYARHRGRIIIEGVLIGTMPRPDTQSAASKDLLYDIEKQQTVDGTWEVMGLMDMLARTQRVHAEILNALAADEDGQAIPAEQLPAPADVAEPADVAGPGGAPVEAVAG